MTQSRILIIGVLALGSWHWGQSKTPANLREKS